MRVTTQMFYDHFLTGLQQNLQAELQDTDQVSSGKKISRPSDDPGTLWKIVDYQTQLSALAEYQQAMSAAKAPVQSLDSALSNLNSTLNRANELATNAGNGTMDANSRLMIADEVQSLYSTALNIANTTVGGRYVFAGFQSNVNPIDPTTGEFISDTNSFNIGIANGISVATNISAGSLFSFKRVNTTDSATAILPTYNWTNNGANTIPDADPVSALETSAGAPTAYFASGTSTSGVSTLYGGAQSTFLSSGDIFTANGGAVTVKAGSATTTSNGAFVINSSNNSITIDGVARTITSGIYTGAGLATALSGLVGGVSFSYNAGAHTFSMSGAGHTVDFSASNSRSILGFNADPLQTLGSAGVTSDYAVGDVNLAAGSTLQDVRDAFNTAAAGVKAQVVNVGTSAKPDFRLIVASNPAGNSTQIDISVLLNPTNDPGINMLSYDNKTGVNMTLGTNITNYNYINATTNDSMVIDDGTNGGVANNQIIFQENGGANITAKIARGTYTPNKLAAALASALTTAPGAANTYTASYDPNTRKFIINNTAGGRTFRFFWSNPSSTATQLLGNNQTDSATYAAGTTNIASNNAVLANYYSFNNNYLNDTNILRALNFELVTLQNNDTGRIPKSLKYLSDLSDAVSQSQALTGATENEIALEGSYQTSSQTDIQTFMSNDQDTDIAKVSSDVAQRQTALQALRTVSAAVLNQSLFDFLKF